MGRRAHIFRVQNKNQIQQLLQAIKDFNWEKESYPIYDYGVVLKNNGEKWIELTAGQEHKEISQHMKSVLPEEIEYYNDYTDSCPSWWYGDSKSLVDYQFEDFEELLRKFEDS